jgi:hypothetical protein
VRRQLPAGCRHDRPAGPAAKSLLRRGAPGPQRPRSARRSRRAPRSPRAAARVGYEATPSPPDFLYGRIRQQIRSGPPSECPLQKKPKVSQTAPCASPHRRTHVPFRRQGRNAATRVNLPNSPRHHAETSTAGVRLRTGRYECRHHRWPTVVAGVNNRRSVLSRQCVWSRSAVDYCAGPVAAGTVCRLCSVNGRGPRR